MAGKNRRSTTRTQLTTLVCGALLIFLPATGAPALGQNTQVTSGKRYPRIIIRNATVVDGNGTPAAGPKDIVIEGNRIADVVGTDLVALKSGKSKRVAGDVEIDATGKYVLPGLIDAHAHLQDERAGVPQPFDYELKLWLACGITTVRDVGSDTKKALELRRKSEAGEIAAPRIFIYPMFGNTSPVPKTPEQARERVRQLHQMGVDGIKILDIDRDLMAAMEDEAHKFGLRIAHHAGVEETNAWDDIKFGTTSIEHWYGIPDAALEAGVQNFPSSYNYNNEVDRFRYAGHLWREANPERLSKVFEAMIDAHVAWVPTMDIYEASPTRQFGGRSMSSCSESSMPLYCWASTRFAGSSVETRP